jgi:hypothetical protein
MMSRRIGPPAILLSCALVATLAGGVSLARAAEPQAPAASQNPPTDPNFKPEEALAALRKQIGGSETKPAEEVFKNIQTFKGRQAQQVLRTMEGWSRALGVNCLHCHVADQWDKDDKQPKQPARDMVALVASTNAELRKIKNLKSENPTVGCSTCHRGQVRPNPNAQGPGGPGGPGGPPPGRPPG